MLTNFSITSFRGIETRTLSLGQRTYIQGANGSGKTHILDAIHLLSGGRPLYGNTSLEKGSLFDGVFLHDTLAKSYRFFHDETRDFYAIQGKKITKPKYMSTLPWRTVYISPFDMNLLYFAPNMRRDAMDLVLSRVYEQFSGVKRDYELTMRQRNALLKNIREGIAERRDLDFWDTKFADLAELYLLYREKYTEYITSALSELPEFFGRYDISFRYISSLDESDVSLSKKEAIRSGLSVSRERDIITGHTHIGPHRDDWGFVITSADSGSLPIETYFSRGEMKMVLLGLKIIEARFVSKILNIPAILLVDDIFAELDEINSEIFLNSLKTYQVILTSQKPLPNHEKHHDFICINLEDS